MSTDTSNRLLARTLTPYLPPEILTAIFMESADFEAYLGKVCLHTFALVCKDWYYTIKSLLWDFTLVASDQKVQFMKSIWKDGEGSDWITNLHVKGTYFRIDPDSSHDWEELALSSQSFEDLVKLVPQITRLSISDLQFTPSRSISSSPFPFLTYFSSSINDSTFDFTSKVITQATLLQDLDVSISPYNKNVQLSSIPRCSILQELSIELRSPSNLIDSTQPILPRSASSRLSKLKISINTTDEATDYSQIIGLLATGSSSSLKYLSLLKYDWTYSTSGMSSRFDYTALSSTLNNLSILETLGIDFENTPINFLQQIPNSITSILQFALSTSQLIYFKKHPRPDLNLINIVLQDLQPISEGLLPNSVKEITVENQNDLEELTSGFETSILSGLNLAIKKVTSCSFDYDSEEDEEAFDYDDEERESFISRFAVLGVELELC